VRGGDGHRALEALNCRSDAQRVRSAPRLRIRLLPSRSLRPCHATTCILTTRQERFVSDARQWLLKIAPPTYPWLHNDVDFRAGPPGYPGGDEAWRAMRMKEPPNAHSHVIQFVVGTTEAIPIHEGKMTIGTFQNIIVVDADGPAGDLGSPKTRTICVQVQGDDGK
jgi:thiamine phosphate synthase YjbQ (UPF0047 family)